MFPIPMIPRRTVLISFAFIHADRQFLHQFHITQRLSQAAMRHATVANGVREILYFAITIALRDRDRLTISFGGQHSSPDVV